MGGSSVKVCCSGKCRGRGADRIFSALEKGIDSETASVEKTTDCFGYCGLGPNVAVNGNILHHMHPDTAVETVQKEIVDPSPKIHGIGSKGMDDLDSLLDSF